MSNSRPIHWFLLLAVSFIWGTSFLAIHKAVLEFEPIEVATIRITIAAILLNLYVMFRGEKRPKLRDESGRIQWSSAVGMGVFSNALPFTMLSYAQQYVTSSFAGVTMALVPFAVLPLAHFFTDDKMNARKSLGFAIGFLGVIILINPFGGEAARAEAPIPLLPELLCVLTAISYAIGSIFTRRAKAKSPYMFSANSLLVASLLLLPLTFGLNGLPEGSSTPWLATLYLGIFPTALATLLLVKIVHDVSPSFLSLSNYLVPLWATAIGTIVLNEILPPQFFPALVVIFFGLFVVNYRSSKSQVSKRKLRKIT